MPFERIIIKLSELLSFLMIQQFHSMSKLAQSHHQQPQQNFSHCQSHTEPLPTFLKRFYEESNSVTKLKRLIGHYESYPVMNRYLLPQIKQIIIENSSNSSTFQNPQVSREFGFNLCPTKILESKSNSLENSLFECRELLETLDSLNLEAVQLKKLRKRTCKKVSEEFFQVELNYLPYRLKKEAVQNRKPKKKGMSKNSKARKSLWCQTHSAFSLKSSQFN